MRTQHPNLWHPIRFAIMLIVLAWTIYGVCYEPPTDIFGVIWVAMLVTALVLSPLFLKSTSVAILVIASIGDLFTPYGFLQVVDVRCVTNGDAVVFRVGASEVVLAVNFEDPRICALKHDRIVVNSHVYSFSIRCSSNLQR